MCELNGIENYCRKTGDRVHSSENNYSLVNDKTSTIAQDSVLCVKRINDPGVEIVQLSDILIRSLFYTAS